MHHDPDAAMKEEQRLTGDEKYDIGYYGTDSITDEDVGRLLAITEQAEQFENMMMYFDCAMSQVRTKLEILNKEMALKNRRNPFEYIKSRLKSPSSIYGKLKVKGVPFTVENIENTINDVAGIRVICSFIDDIYSIRDSFDVQDDVEILQEKDYIASPKENGYRSLHLILRVPIFLSSEKKYMNVEVQFRTIAMDFWASVEHKMKYKREINNAEIIVEELRYSADLINQLDRRMLQIRERIERSEVPSEEEKRA
jgi:putative GTP pyrophosphokinase